MYNKILIHSKSTNVIFGHCYFSYIDLFNEISWIFISINKAKVNLQEDSMRVYCGIYMVVIHLCLCASSHYDLGALYLIIWHFTCHQMVDWKHKESTFSVQDQRNKVSTMLIYRIYIVHVHLYIYIFICTEKKKWNTHRHMN